MLGIERFPGDDTIRNLFRRFRMGECERLFSPLWSSMLSRLPSRPEGYTLDLDSTVFERYGQRQEGALKGYNPRKPGRVSHHPLLAVLAGVNFILHGWLRSGNLQFGAWGEGIPLRSIGHAAKWFDGQFGSG